MSILSTSKISIEFGGLKALDGVDLNIDEGTITSIVGPNGAGKTTLFNVLSGLYRATTGAFIYEGQDVTSFPPYKLSQLGIARTFQNLQLFSDMNLRENVIAGTYSVHMSGFWSDVFRLPQSTTVNMKASETADKLLEFIGLREHAEKLAGSLSYGMQKRLEIARALASKPNILLLDEPAAGCNATETTFINEIIVKSKQAGKTILLIEHDMKLVMNISDKVIVLEYGKKIAEGTPNEVTENKEVVAAYLGVDVIDEACHA